MSKSRPTDGETSPTRGERTALDAGIVPRLLEAVGDGWWDWHIGADRVHFSDGWCRALGFEPDEVNRSERFWAGLVHPDDLDRVRERQAAHLDGETALYECGYRIRTRDGEYRRTLSRGLVVERDETGAALRMVGTNDWLVARDAADREIAASQQTLHDFVDHSPQAIHIKDRSSRYVHVNPAFERLLDVEARDVVGKGPRELLPSDVAARVLADDALVFESGRPVSDEVRLPVGDTVRTMLVEKFPIRDADGAIVGLGALGTDVSEKRSAERALATSEARFRGLVEGSIQGVIVHRGGVLLFANTALASILGYPSPEALLGRNDSEALAAPHERRRLHGYAIARLRGGDAPSVYEFEALRADGTTIAVECRAATLEWDGETALLDTIVDVSERREAERELAASERRFRELAAGSAQGLVIHRDGIPLFANRALADILGYEDPDDLIGMHWFDTFAPADRERVIRNIQARARGEDAPNAYQYDAVRRDGSIVNLHVVARVVEWEGAPAVQAALIDVSDRVRAERALVASETRFRNLVEGSLQGMIVHRGGPPLFANTAIARILGYDSVESLLRLNWLEDTGAPHEVDRLRGYTEARIAGREAPSEYEYDAVRADGAIVTLECRVTTMEWEGKRAVLATFADVSARREALDSLARSEARFRALIDYLPAAVYLKEPSGAYLLVNRTAREWNAAAADELIGRDCDCFLDADAVARSREIDAKILESGEPAHYETETEYRDGNRRSVEIIKFPIFDVDGEISLLGSIDIDVTSRIDAERAHRQIERELQSAQKLQTVGQLTGGIAHDFNNILGVILGYANLALERDNATKREEYLAQIRVAGERGRDLVSKMLTFSRGGGGESRSIDPHEIVTGCTNLLRSTLPSSMVISVDAAPDLPSVFADPTQLEQVVMNLCINARDASEGDGRIVVSLRHRSDLRARCSSCLQTFGGDFVEIAIADSGSGIRPEIVERIFDPFFTTKEVGRGTGLGLSVVHGVVHEIGGHVGVEAHPGGGAVVRTWLARSRSAPQRREPRVDDSGRVSAGAATRVLVVDDEPALARLVSEILEGAGHDVTALTDPESALRMYLEDPYRFDALVTDQTMPKLSGIELAKACRAIRPDLRVTLCTGYSERVDGDSAIELGVQCFLSKPIDARALLASIAPPPAGSDSGGDDSARESR